MDMGRTHCHDQPPQKKRSQLQSGGTLCIRWPAECLLLRVLVVVGGQPTERGTAPLVAQLTVAVAVAEATLHYASHGARFDRYLPDGRL